MAQPLEILEQLAELEVDHHHRWDIEQLQNNKTYNEIKAKIDKQLIKEIRDCSQTSTAVNIANITAKLTDKLQLNFDPHYHIDLKDAYWQSHIAKAMAEALTTLNYQQVQCNENGSGSQWECTVCHCLNTSDEYTCFACFTPNQGDLIPPSIQQNNSINIRRHSHSDDIKETIPLEEIVSEPGLELQNLSNLLNELQNDTVHHNDEEDNHSSTKNNEQKSMTCDAISVRWKARKNFRVERGITTTQITKIGNSYSSIFSLEPMVSRKYKYTFLLSNITETDKPWLGIGIISSKCPLLSANQSIAWHAANEYSIGWYYGTEIWHTHAPLRTNYGNGAYWKSGDEIELIVDCRNYTLGYKLNGVDLGIAATNFDKLLNSDKRCHFYVIVSILHDMNSITLMDAHRYREDRNRNNIHISCKDNANHNNDDKWNKLSFFDAFKHPNATKREKKSDSAANDELEVLRDKLLQQTKLSAAFQQKWETLVHSYHDLKKMHEEQKKELHKLQHVVTANQKELDLSRGVMHALKKLSIHKLHELESHLLGSIQNVQKAIANQYENKYDCRVCMTNEKDTVLIPCGHFLCSQCVSKVNECPMCRANIEKTVKLN